MLQQVFSCINITLNIIFSVDATVWAKKELIEEKQGFTLQNYHSKTPKCLHCIKNVEFLCRIGRYLRKIICTWKQSQIKVSQCLMATILEHKEHSKPML